jgi:cytochrome c-type biogenesis protein CcmH
MGWFFLLLFAGLTGAGLWFSKRLSRTAFELAIVAILVGLAGYAWQGSPSLAGSPVTHALPQ